MPSGLFCCTILSPGNAAGHAAAILGMQDHVIWSRLTVKKFMNIKKNLTAVSQGQHYKVSDGIIQFTSGHGKIL
uniref:Uncharacterized protein n=1 Tax=Romanomermis culicivorax TaxID=13658 RepID=A0A915I7H7_ROMCU